MSEVELLRLIELKASGVDRKSIAEELGIHPTRVWQLTQTEEYKALWQQTVDEAIRLTKEKIAVRTEAAADKVFTLMEHAQSEKVQLASAQDILDRGGVEKRQEVRNVFTVRIEQDRARLFTTTARELGA